MSRSSSNCSRPRGSRCARPRYGASVSTTGRRRAQLRAPIIVCLRSRHNPPIATPASGPRACRVRAIVSMGGGRADLQVCVHLAGRRAARDGMCRRARRSIARRAGGRVVWRIGYDLLGEVQSLLTEGQPAAAAATPTLDLTSSCAAPAARVGCDLPRDSAAADGYDFTCCLTHDVDFFGIRRHRLPGRWPDSRSALRSERVDWLRGRGAPQPRRPQPGGAPLGAPGVPRAGAGFLAPFDDYAPVEDAQPRRFSWCPSKAARAWRLTEASTPLRAVSLSGIREIAEGGAAAAAVAASWRSMASTPGATPLRGVPRWRS